MKKMLLIVALLGIISISSNSQVKRVLLEQHTGAWCGWCVDGTVVMDDILSLLPDQVIGVKIHNGDSMAIPEQAIIGSGLGISSYPTGTIDRKKFGQTVAQDRGSWKNFCTSQAALTPKVDINVAYNINESTRQVMVKIYATMLETVYEPLRFNALVIEDSVSGKGTGWDQSNYLSGRAGYENNPYYKLPSKLIGYQHMKVVRTYIGGSWGVQGSFVSPATQGSVYTHEFSYTLPTSWKIKDIKIIGLIQLEAPSNKEILNCAYGVKGEAKLQMTFSGNVKDVIEPNASFTKEYTLKNITSQPLTFVVNSKKSTRTPAGWKAEITGMKDGAEIMVNPNEEKKISLSLTPDASIGIGDASVKVSVKDDATAFSGNGSITAYSSKIQNIEVVNAGESKYSMAPILNVNGFDSYYALSSVDFNEMGSKFKTKTLIWNTGASEVPSATDINSIMSAIQAKVPVYVCGNQMTSALNGGNALQLFGAEYNGYSTQGFGSSPWRVWLAGVTGDPISGAYGSTVEGNLINYLITLVKINNAQIATPFMTFANAGKRVVYNYQTGKRDTFDINGPDAIMGIKIDNGSQRFALWGICPNVVVNGQIRSNVNANIVRWINYVQTDVDELDEATAEVFPIPANDNVNFRFVEDRFNKIKIFNLMGELIQEINVDNVDSYQLNSSGMNPGTYYGLITGNSKKAVVQFSVIR
jgi:hypothetical protein